MADKQIDTYAIEDFTSACKALGINGSGDTRLLQFDNDSNWTTISILLNGWSGIIRFIRRAGNVTVVGVGLDGSSASGISVIVLSERYRPNVSIPISAASDRSGTINPTGEITLELGFSDSRFSVSYPVL